MKILYPSRLVVMTCAAALIPGCASFNDTLVVDIGDQFELLKLGTNQGQETQREADRVRGFECDFDAHSERISLFGRERHVSGTIRCHALGTAPPADPMPAAP